MTGLLVHSSAKDAIDTRLERAVSSVVPAEQTTFCRGIDHLAAVWRRPTPKPGLAIIRAADRTELAGLIQLRKLFGETRLILIVPDEDGETLALAHQFRPNYLTFARSDFEDVAAVLRKVTRSPAWLIGPEGEWGDET